jgi:hypothetical protein
MAISELYDWCGARDEAQAISEAYGLELIKWINDGPNGWPLVQFMGTSEAIQKFYDDYENGLV